MVKKLCILLMMFNRLSIMADLEVFEYYLNLILQ